jgi:hypothetical protein
VIIHKRDLATFGYRPAMNENRNLLKSLYILVTYLLEQCVETWQLFRNLAEVYEKKGNI